MLNPKTFDDLLDELTATVKTTLNKDGRKIGAKWSWGNEYHIYWDRGWLKNQLWTNYIVIVATQLDFDSRNIKDVNVDVYTPKILSSVEQIFAKYGYPVSIEKHFPKK